jgi:hypothetical protein
VESRPSTCAGSPAGPTMTYSFCITSRRLSPKPSDTNASSAAREWAQTTSACPARAMARASPEPEKVACSVWPASRSKVGASAAYKPESGGSWTSPGARRTACRSPRGSRAAESSARRRSAHGAGASNVVAPLPTLPFQPRRTIRAVSPGSRLLPLRFGRTTHFNSSSLLSFAPRMGAQSTAACRPTQPSTGCSGVSRTS